MFLRTNPTVSVSAVPKENKLRNVFEYENRWNQKRVKNGGIWNYEAISEVVELIKECIHSYLSTYIFIFPEFLSDTLLFYVWISYFSQHRKHLARVVLFLSTDNSRHTPRQLSNSLLSINLQIAKALRYLF